MRSAGRRRRSARRERRPRRPRPSPWRARSGSRRCAPKPGPLPRRARRRLERPSRAALRSSADVSGGSDPACLLRGRGATEATARIPRTATISRQGRELASYQKDSLRSRAGNRGSASTCRIRQSMLASGRLSRSKKGAPNLVVFGSLTKEFNGRRILRRSSRSVRRDRANDAGGDRVGHRAQGVPPAAPRPENGRHAVSVPAPLPRGLRLRRQLRRQGSAHARRRPGGPAGRRGPPRGAPRRGHAPRRRGGPGPRRAAPRRSRSRSRHAVADGRSAAPVPRRHGAVRHPGSLARPGAGRRDRGRGPRLRRPAPRSSSTPICAPRSS